MIKKSISLLLTLLCCFALAQVRINAFGNWIPISHPTGGTATDPGISVQFHLDSPDEIAWSLSSRITSAITNGTKEFPPQKTSLKIKNITMNNPGDLASISATQLGARSDALPQNFSEQFLIERSPYRLKTRYYAQFTIDYELRIEGGGYLNDYKSWQNYQVPLTFTFYNQNGNILSSSSIIMAMQIHPGTNYGPSTPEPVYALKINPAATIALLEFNSKEQYAQGTYSLYRKGITVSSNTGFEIQVRALTPTLEHESGLQQLPLGTVGVQINEGLRLPLSAEAQTLYSSGTSAQNQDFDLKYSTKAADEKIFNARPGNYSTTLTYTLIPK